MAENKMLKITLVKSTIGAVPKNKATALSMGLRKLNKSVILPDNAATRGQIQQISHLIKVEEVYTDRRCQNGIIKFKTRRRFQAQ